MTGAEETAAVTLEALEVTDGLDVAVVVDDEEVEVEEAEEEDDDDDGAVRLKPGQSEPTSDGRVHGMTCK